MCLSPAKYSGHLLARTQDFDEYSNILEGRKIPSIRSNLFQQSNPSLSGSKESTRPDQRGSVCSEPVSINCESQSLGVRTVHMRCENPLYPTRHNIHRLTSLRLYSKETKREVLLDLALGTLCVSQALLVNVTTSK